MNQKTHWGFITTSLVALVIAITAISASGFSTERDIQQLSQSPVIISKVTAGKVAGVAVEVASMTIDRPAGNSLSVEFEVTHDMTVFDALQEVADNYGLNLQTKQYDFGVLVEGIGDLVGGQDNKFWLYYVNGVMAMNSVDTQIVIPGDLIEFRFEESTF